GFEQASPIKDIIDTVLKSLWKSRCPSNPTHRHRVRMYLPEGIDETRLLHQHRCGKRHDVSTVEVLGFRHPVQMRPRIEIATYDNRYAVGIFDSGMQGLQYAAQDTRILFAAKLLPPIRRINRLFLFK